MIKEPLLKETALDELYTGEREPSIDDLIAATRLTRDLKKAAATLDKDQAAYFVGLYYSLQKLRIGAAAQARAAMDAKEPNTLVSWTEEMYGKLETDVQAALGVYAKSKVPGQWALAQKGIGPVIAAGLLAHVDITKTPTAGALWSFAGYNPNIKWLGREGAAKLVAEILGPGKAKEILSDEQVYHVAIAAHRNPARLGEQAQDEDGDITRASLTAVLAKRPWNARLKVLGWKASQSFVKSSGREGAFYGKMYKERKAQELWNNNMMLIPGSDPARYKAIVAGEPGLYAEQAARILQEKKIGEDTEARRWYEMGMLPPAHIQARAERYATKMFLSHFLLSLTRITMVNPLPAHMLSLI